MSFFKIGYTAHIPQENGIHVVDAEREKNGWVKGQSMDADIQNAITKLRQRAQWLLQQAEQLERAAPLLASEPPKLGDDPFEHNTAAGRARIAEANRRLWVVCPRPECKGVKHRRTHPHIVSSGGGKKSKRHVA